MNARIQIEAVDGIGEVGPGVELGQVLATHLDDLRDGDVVIVTSKVVSKAAGRVSGLARSRVIEAETVQVVAQRGTTTIARTRHGFVLAAAGVDASNVEAGSVVMLPEDPDANARSLREALLERCGVNVGVILTDTAGRAWRRGQTDIAVGSAGLLPVDDLAGQVDAYANVLAVTAPAIVDELAGAAELVSRKLAGRPAAVVRGLGQHVLAAGDHGPGVAELIRPVAEDMFGLGSREAVEAAVVGNRPPPFSTGELSPSAMMGRCRKACADLEGLTCEIAGHRLELVGADIATRWRAAERIRILAWSHGWRAETGVETHSTLAVLFTRTVSYTLGSRTSTSREPSL
jgi:coenzyme F420-0:L-glutamate ligase / coenzyme F420-1:gamma-L-glutamate ligase